MHKLAASMAVVPYEVLAQNESICNKAVELIATCSSRSLARTGPWPTAPPAASEFFRISAERGLKAACQRQRSAQQERRV